MPNNWNAIYLGTRAIIDPTEGNTTAENAAALTGQTFGAQGTPLSQQITFITTQDRGGTSGVMDQNNSSSNDRLTFNIGQGSQTTNFDAAVQYNATLTYDNGTTFTGTFVIMQDTAGRTFLAPPLAVGAVFDALQANPIRSITINSVVNSTFSGLQQDRPTVNFLTCFAAGTRIDIGGHEVPVETLAKGDLVATADAGQQTLRWVGAQTVCGTGQFAPILFRAGALGNTRDLRVSPQHRMLVSGWQAELLFGCDAVLVPACQLLNDHSIRRAPVERITYHHLMFDAHQIVSTEGCRSESFFPGPSTIRDVAPATRAELLALFPGLAGRGAGYGATARRVLRSGEARVLRRMI